MNVGYFAANLAPPYTGLETIYIVYIFAVIVFQCENNCQKISKLRTSLVQIPNTKGKFYRLTAYAGEHLSV